MLTRHGDLMVDTDTGEALATARPRDSRPSFSEAREALALSILGKRKPVLRSLTTGYHGNPFDAYWCPHTGDIWICGRCNEGFERSDGKPVAVATPEQVRRAVTFADDISWHFRGEVIWAGRDTEGADWERDVKTGKTVRVYSARQRSEAMRLAAEYGLSAASRKTGIPRSTLNNWKARGVAA